MNWVQIISSLFTNELRLFLGIYFIFRFTGFSLKRKSLLVISICGCIITVLQVMSVSVIGVITVEVLVIAAVVWYYLRKKLNVCLFQAIFYEMGVALWDFLFQAGFGIFFQSENFVTPNTLEYLTGIWFVRLVLLGFAVICLKKQKKSFPHMRLISIVMMLSLFGAVTLSEQTILPLNDEQTGTWVILSMVLLFSVLFYRLSHQREMELEIAQLKQNQADILKQDYQRLRRTYESNAKLYHDLHNHIESIYQCLTQGDIPEAIRYCEDLRIPVQEISQTIWTGDKAIDYLISSKLALAKQEQIRTKVNIEYPHHTNIHNVDLITILGNLLDNALEAAQEAPDELRFLNLTVRRINAMLIIKVENGYGKTPDECAGKLMTSKTDQVCHGWGIKSIQTTADRYDGVITTNYKDGIFQSVVNLFFQPIKME